MNRAPGRVVHFGPDPHTQGGIGAVIAQMISTPSDRYRHVNISTWRPGAGFLNFVLPFLAALHLMFRRPVLAHMHVSEGGSFVREGALVQLGAALRIPVAITTHGADWLEGTDQRFPWWQRRCFSSADVAFALGSRSRERLERAGCRRVVMIDNPVDLSTTGGVTTARAPHFAFSGELGPRKGFDRWIAAWPSISSSIDGATTTCMGPIAHEPTQYPDAMTVRGALPRAEALRVLETATILCLPSRREVLPMAVIEALAKGLQAVVTDTGEMAGLAALPGVHLTDGEPSAIASACIRAWHQRDLHSPESIAAAARTRFSSATVVAAIEDAYDELLSSPAEKRPA